MRTNLLAALRAPERGRPPEPFFVFKRGRGGTVTVLDLRDYRDELTCELPHRFRETFAEFGGKTNA